ncbi:uncharacterized protein ACIBXB_001102 [Morphnus guianensis]
MAVDTNVLRTQAQRTASVAILGEMPQVKLSPEAEDRRPSHDPLWSCFEGDGRRRGRSGDRCGYISGSSLQAAVCKPLMLRSQISCCTESMDSLAHCALPDKRMDEIKQQPSIYPAQDIQFFPGSPRTRPVLQADRHM